MKTVRYGVTLEGDTNGWDATVPDLNVFATSKTREDVERLVKEAVEFHIEGLRERGEPVPPPRFVDTDYVEVA